ncbi:MAG: hypothetical protein EP329_19950 [Deltaproteobacteria bacterium]|nr:MAG: hypothetical protein EP329_19950 [Deltaproteobacteria bacterium]
MGTDDTAIDLGFTSMRVPAGTHVCQLYAEDDERNEVLLRFLTGGLRGGEATACFSDGVSEAELATALTRSGLSLEAEVAAGRLSLASPAAVYFEGGRFDPERMLARLTSFHDDAVAAGRPAARVIGEMSPEIGSFPGGSRLLEYESRVNRLLCTHPVTAVCQYDARRFDGATLMDVLSVHPMMIVGGGVVYNPFYMTPEELPRRDLP